MVNFINMFMSSFYVHRSRKHKKLFELTVFFALLGSGRVKSAHKMMVKLTPALDAFVDLQQYTIKEQQPFFSKELVFLQQNCRWFIFSKQSVVDRFILEQSILACREGIRYNEGSISPTCLKLT